MRQTPTVLLISCCLLACLTADASETIPEPAARPPVAKPVPGPAEANIKAGRELFQKKQYAAAFEKFTLALAINPKHRDARFLAGLAAYWARRPEQALEHWNTLLDTTVRNSDEEWLLETHRVQALYALNQAGAAEQVVERIYELRSKAPAGRTARGFVREHIYVGSSRIGCWEAFDEKGEVQDQWSLPVAALKLPDEPAVARLYVTAAPLPAGANGFVFGEEGPDYARVYKRWNQRPDYAEVRALLTQVCQGKLPPLEDLQVDNSAKFPAAKEARVAQGQAADPDRATPAPAAPAPAGDTKAVPPEAPPPEPKQRVLTETEQEAVAKVASLGLDPMAARILVVAARLHSVNFDVTRLTRLSLTDKLLAERHLGDLNAKAPFAQEDAAELVELISKAKPEHVREACSRLAKLGPRQPYLEYALLTALNTRGHDVPQALLKDFAKSPDFMVRQTAALLLGRGSDKRGLVLLFKELEQADALSGAILQGSIEELVGPVLGAPPPARAASAGAGLNDAEEQAFKAWQQKAAKWWQEHGGKLAFENGQWIEPAKKAR